MANTIFGNPAVLDQLMKQIIDEQVTAVQERVDRAVLYGMQVRRSPYVPASQKVKKLHSDWRERMHHNSNLPLSRLKHTLPLEYEVEEPVIYLVTPEVLPKIVYREPVFEW